MVQVPCKIEAQMASKKINKINKQDDYGFMQSKNGIKQLQIYKELKGTSTARTPHTIAWLINNQEARKQTK